MRQTWTPSGVYLATWLFPVSATITDPSGPISMPEGYISAWRDPPRVCWNVGAGPLSAAPPAVVHVNDATREEATTTAGPTRRRRPWLLRSFSTLAPFRGTAGSRPSRTDFASQDGRRRWPVLEDALRAG